MGNLYFKNLCMYGGPLQNSQWHIPTKISLSTSLTEVKFVITQLKPKYNPVLYSIFKVKLLC